MWQVTPPNMKRDPIKMRDYMDRRVTPPKRVSSPSWGPPPPCKQALSNDPGKVKESCFVTLQCAFPTWECSHLHRPTERPFTR